MSDFAVGSNIRGYTITKKIGRGSFGEVLVVREAVSGIEHVLKISVHNESYVNEISALRALSHHNSFPTLISQFHHLNKLCIVMSEEGISIKDYLKRNEHPIFTLQNSLRLGLRICSVLHELHIHGFVHRDVHGANCLLKPENNKLVLKLADFGTAVKNYSSDAMNLGHFARRTWFSSLNVFRGGPYGVVDDFVSSLYILLLTRGEWAVGLDAVDGFDPTSDFDLSVDGGVIRIQ